MSKRDDDVQRGRNRSWRLVVLFCEKSTRTFYTVFFRSKDTFLDRNSCRTAIADRLLAGSWHPLFFDRVVCNLVTHTNHRLLRLKWCLLTFDIGRRGAIAQTKWRGIFLKIQSASWSWWLGSDVLKITANLNAILLCKTACESLFFRLITTSDRVVVVFAYDDNDDDKH